VVNAVSDRVRAEMLRRIGLSDLWSRRISPPNQELRSEGVTRSRFSPFHLSMVDLSNRYIAKPVRLFQGFHSRAHTLVVSKSADLNAQTGSSSGVALLLTSIRPAAHGSTQARNWFLSCDAVKWSGLCMSASRPSLPMVHPMREPDHEYGPRVRAQHSGDDGSLQEYVDPDQESFPFRTVWADSHGTPA
jgi:hypothetical protein